MAQLQTVQISTIPTVPAKIGRMLKFMPLSGLNRYPVAAACATPSRKKRSTSRFAKGRDAFFSNFKSLNTASG